MVILDVCFQVIIPAILVITEVALKQLFFTVSRSKVPGQFKLVGQNLGTMFTLNFHFFSILKSFFFTHVTQLFVFCNQLNLNSTFWAGLVLSFSMSSFHVTFQGKHRLRTYFTLNLLLGVSFDVSFQSVDVAERFGANITNIVFWLKSKNFWFLHELL